MKRLLGLAATLAVLVLQQTGGAQANLMYYPTYPELHNVLSPMNLCEQLCGRCGCSGVFLADDVCQCNCEARGCDPGYANCTDNMMQLCDEADVDCEFPETDWPEVGLRPRTARGDKCMECHEEHHHDCGHHHHHHDHGDFHHHEEEHHGGGKKFVCCKKKKDKKCKCKKHKHGHKIRLKIKGKLPDCCYFQHEHHHHEHHEHHEHEMHVPESHHHEEHFPAPEPAPIPAPMPAPMPEPLPPPMPEPLPAPEPAEEPHYEEKEKPCCHGGHGIHCDNCHIYRDGQKHSGGSSGKLPGYSLANYRSTADDEDEVPPVDEEDEDTDRGRGKKTSPKKKQSSSSRRKDEDKPRYPIYAESDEKYDDKPEKGYGYAPSYGGGHGGGGGYGHGGGYGGPSYGGPSHGYGHGGGPPSYGGGYGYSGGPSHGGPSYGGGGYGGAPAHGGGHGYGGGAPSYGGGYGHGGGPNPGAPSYGSPPAAHGGGYSQGGAEPSYGGHGGASYGHSAPSYAPPSAHSQGGAEPSQGSHVIEVTNHKFTIPNEHVKPIMDQLINHQVPTPHPIELTIYNQIVNQQIFEQRKREQYSTPIFQPTPRPLRDQLEPKAVETSPGEYPQREEQESESPTHSRGQEYRPVSPAPGAFVAPVPEPTPGHFGPDSGPQVFELPEDGPPRTPPPPPHYLQEQEGAYYPLTQVGPQPQPVHVIVPWAAAVRAAQAAPCHHGVYMK